MPDRFVTHGKPALLHSEVGFTGRAIAERIEAAIVGPHPDLDRSGSLRLTAREPWPEKEKGPPCGGPVLGGGEGDAGIMMAASIQ